MKSMAEPQADSKPTPVDGDPKQTPQQPATQVDATPPQDDDSTQEDERTVSWADHRKVKSEAQALRKRLKEALAEGGKKPKADADADDDVASLREKLKAKDQREEELMLQIRQRDARDSVMAVIGSQEEGNRYRAVNAKAVWTLIRPDLEIDDDGTVLNLKDVLMAAKKEYPELFHSPHTSGDGGAGNSGKEARKGSSFMNEQIRRIAGR
jgi:hypothetical protein